MTTLVAEEELERFQVLVAERLGLLIPDMQLEALAALLRERVDANGGIDVLTYLASLAAGPNAERELRTIAEALTIGETYFFRTPDHWRAFGELVLPALAAAAGPTRLLRLLSAGCASGDEAYTMAMVVRACLPAEAQARVEILGVDINQGFLAKAHEARYSSWSLRGVPEHVCRGYFRRDAHGFRLDPGLRDMVTFEVRNLLADDPEFWRPQAFDAIFCRNVGIYFSPDATRRLIARFARALVPGGYLFLGPAESLRGISRDFHLQHTHQTFYYQRREAPGTAGRPLDLASWTNSTATAASTASPVPLALEDSWVEAIQHASERISRLAEGVAPPANAQAETPRNHGLTEAIEKFRDERFGETLTILRGLPTETSADPDVKLLMATALTNAGELAAAEEVCREVLTLDELSAGAHYLLALCREHAGDLPAAVVHDETAIYLDTAFAMPHLHMGLMAARAGEQARARAAFERAQALLAREDAARILLFGGGFSREVLQVLCVAELRRIEGRP